MPVTTQDIQLPSMSPGTRRSLVVHRYGTPGAGPKAYFHAALHADELPAILALHHLMPKLEAAQAQGRIRGEIVVVPVANPIGIGQVVGSYFTGRFDLATRENYNRGFGPDWAELAERVKDRLGADAEANKSLIRAAAVAYCAEQAPATELEALRWKLLELSVDADLVFDCHCAAESLLYLVVYKECLDIGGRDLADAIGSDATFIMDWYADKRTFMTTVGTLWPAVRARAPAGAPVSQGCVTATLEYRGRLDVDDRLGADDAERLYRFLVRRGVIDDEPGPVPTPVRAPVPTSHTAPGSSPMPGGSASASGPATSWPMSSTPMARIRRCRAIRSRHPATACSTCFAAIASRVPIRRSSGWSPTRRSSAGPGARRRRTRNAAGGVA
jgi:predicted deacylase